ncbi:MAG: NAD(P)-binding protein [Rhodocyclaceae bacterium]|nr:NAD(P)-binding protein [Rhodocyclaceae bacterium]MCA3076665.1 NAD(P)-binding protein [Rhodocyclaceae bacterium]MCA3089605.1 NAD(P)-binding protein [Rhodocyclaceae bacterium]MCA3094445.1 NAD(P)-binding protein [Rhodocyclaceae bacterium]MCA3100097.1 NAD(P)-binding protein [Rhodocyclaceae bacterium]
MAKERIVVLGGGCAAMATVFALTDRPGWQERYDITVYQPGGRLGGKGAAGRNEDRGDRIEEHGLHLWSGFYENAFWMMRKAFAELERPPSAPVATLHTAFKPRHFAGLGSESRGDAIFWSGYLPQDPGQPGDFIPDD